MRMASIFVRESYRCRICLRKPSFLVKPTQIQQFSSSRSTSLRIRPGRSPVRTIGRVRPLESDADIAPSKSPRIGVGGNEGLTSRTSLTLSSQPRDEITRETANSRNHPKGKRNQGNELEDLVPSKPSAPLSLKAEASKRAITDPSTAEEDVAWYWETLPPTPDQKRRTTQFFKSAAKNAKFLVSVAQFRECPDSDVPEVAFIGRSNVGKSSLLNAIMDRDSDKNSALARTSATPGFTKTMNMYGVGPGLGAILSRKGEHRRITGKGCLNVVDMPGYGEGSVAEWGVEIMKYLENRKQLRRVFVMLDTKLGLKQQDRTILSMLRQSGIPHQVLLSKVDKVYLNEQAMKAGKVTEYDGKKLRTLKNKDSDRWPLSDLHKHMNAIQREIQPKSGAAALGEMIACSSGVRVNGERPGIEYIRFAMLKAAGLI